jgi:hypothetical protein
MWLQALASLMRHDARPSTSRTASGARAYRRTAFDASSVPNKPA